ncbi:hypothetical protein BGX34_011753 [Mortierella sp. NVP85]|nr:hypothetical protein BGX34_011753 [Mortierella sp. NVP85]
MKYILGLATLASVAFADITFNVIGYPSVRTNTFGVSIGGTIHKLATDENSFPVWKGTVPGVDGTVQYQYVETNAQGGAVKTESFVRSLHNQTATSTYNEFFERQTTVWELPKLPYTYLATYPSKTRAFKQKQIATIHLTAPVASITEMMANPTNDKDYKVNFRFINSDIIHSQNNITFSTSGKSSKEFAKQAYMFQFDTEYNQTFFSRPNIKLRSMVNDPSMIREKLYIDMLNSVGVPTQQGAWVRLFINNEPYGVYLMVDDIKKSFAKQTIHGGDPIVRGSMYQMNAWLTKADLVYKGPNTANYDKDAYTNRNLGNNPPLEPMRELIAFMNDLQNFNPASAGGADYWKARFELDGYLRCMALEYLMGAFDMYWIAASNYFMYKNPLLGPGGGKWQWIPTDMDNTFGSGYSLKIVPSYKQFADFSPTKGGERPLIQKLILGNSEINALFEQTLKEIISTAFKPEAIQPRAEAYHRMLSAEAAWDYSLVRKSPGKDRKFTFAEFNTNLYNQTKDVQAGIVGWVRDVSNLVATELKFTIPQGLADRVPPPPKKGHEGNPEDEEDTDVDTEVTDTPAPGSKGSNGKSAANSLFSKSGMIVQAAMASMIAMALML